MVLVEVRLLVPELWDDAGSSIRIMLEICGGGLGELFVILLRGRAVIYFTKNNRATKSRRTEMEIFNVDRILAR